MMDWNFFIDRARAVGQLGVHLLLLLFAGVYLDFLWPGHMDYTDQDMVLVYKTVLIVGGDMGAVFGQHDCFLASKALGQV